MLTGGCFCRAIRYEISGQGYRAVNCHCTMCRRTSAAAFVSWLVVPVEDFRYLAGTPRELRSSDHGTRYFCERCGTPVVCLVAAHPDYVDVTIGSLDEPERAPPEIDVYTATRLSWVDTGLPRPPGRSR